MKSMVILALVFTITSNTDNSMGWGSIKSKRVTPEHIQIAKDIGNSVLNLTWEGLAMNTYRKGSQKSMKVCGELTRKHQRSVNQLKQKSKGLSISDFPTISTALNMLYSCVNCTTLALENCADVATQIKDMRSDIKRAEK